MKSFPGFREMSLKRIVDLIGACRVLLKKDIVMNAAIARLLPRVWASSVDDLEAPYFNLVLLRDRLTRIAVGVDPGSIRSR
jgi:hypothetical protein